MLNILGMYNWVYPFFSVCAVLVFHEYTNTNIGSGRVGTRHKVLPYHQASNTVKQRNQIKPNKTKPKVNILLII